MNTADSKQNSIALIYNTIIDGIGNNILFPSDVLAMSVALIQMTLSNLLGEDQAEITVSQIDAIISSSITANQNAQNKGEEHGQTTC